MYHIFQNLFKMFYWTIEQILRSVLPLERKNQKEALHPPETTNQLEVLLASATMKLGESSDTYYGSVVLYFNTIMKIISPLLPDYNRKIDNVSDFRLIKDIEGLEKCFLRSEYFYTFLDSKEFIFCFGLENKNPQIDAFNDPLNYSIVFCYFSINHDNDIITLSSLRNGKFQQRASRSSWDDPHVYAELDLCLFNKVNRCYNPKPVTDIISEMVKIAEEIKEIEVLNINSH